MNKNSIKTFLNEKLDGCFYLLDHVSDNLHFFGQSDKYKGKIFIKVFSEKNKKRYQSEVIFSKIFLNSLYIDSKIFAQEQQYVLIEKYIEFEHIDKVTDGNIGVIAEQIAAFHKMAKVKKLVMSVETSIIKRVKEHLLFPPLKTLPYYDEILEVYLILTNEDNATKISDEYDEMEKGNIHGDFSLRNLKKNGNNIFLIDFERAKKDTFWSDFIKFHYMNLNDIKMRQKFYSKYLSLHKISVPSDLVWFSLVFFTAIGIFHYICKYEDKEFEEQGLKMLEDAKAFFKGAKNKKIIIPM